MRDVVDNYRRPEVGGAVIGGYSVIVSDLLPMDPDWGKQAERIVRHGLADVLAWLGEDVGPEPDLNPIEVLQDVEGDRLVVSPRVYALLRAEALEQYAYPQRFMTGMDAPDTVEVNTVWGDYPARIIRSDVVEVMTPMGYSLPFDPPRLYLDVTLPPRGWPVGPNA